MDRLPRWADPLLVLLAAAFVFLPRLGSYGLHDPWETHYGEVARNMLASGDWISPWWGSYWPEGAACTHDSDCPADHICRSIRSEYLPRQATCRSKDFNREGEYFFSKPVLSMWMMALGMAVCGVGEWGVRLPFVLLAMLALLAVHGAIRRLFGRRQGLLAALVLLGAPTFFFISRQAMTDGPFVAMLTIGLCFFLTGMLGEEAPPTRRQRWAFAALLVLLVLPQALLLIFGLKVYFRALGFKFFVGALHGGAYLALLAVMLHFTRRATSIRQLRLWTFYAAIGLASLAKGILGVALAGAVILVYLAVSGSWKQLRRAELVKGTLVFAAVAFPWYGAMFARHLHGFFDRFFVHDHIKRLATGVHHLDGGGFEYVLLWLGLGLLPWLGFLPAALGWGAAGHGEAGRAPAHGGEAARGAARLFLLCWVLVPFTLFSLSSTKFHHYVYPIVPPAMILVALYLDRLASSADRNRIVLVLLVALGLNALVAFDLAGDPQRLVNLFTYKYDREWPAELDYAPVLTLLALAAALPLVWWLQRCSRPLGGAAAALLALLAAAVPPDRLPLEQAGEALADLAGLESGAGPTRALVGLLAALLAAGPLLLGRRLQAPATARLLGIAPLLAIGLGFGCWSQTGYLYELSNRWTQARIFDAYFAACTPEPGKLTHAGRPVCREDLISYKMNWRGETFYSENRVIPLLGDKEARYYVDSAAGKRRFFAIIEYTRLQSQLRPLLSATRWKTMRKVFEGNTKFVLLDIPAEN